MAEQRRAVVLVIPDRIYSNPQPQRPRRRTSHILAFNSCAPTMLR
jgi:hypothetical protein